MQAAAPPALPGIVRVTSLNILGVTMTNGLSASDHDVASSATARADSLRFASLRAHGMCDTALQAIYKSVVVAKLLYASSAWAEFITAADRQRVDAFFRRNTRCGFCPSNIPPFE